MGVDLADIVPKTSRTVADYAGRIVAIDAFNTIYQFLASIRQPDGQPLADSKGRITSHLSGCFYRTVNLLEAGIRPVFVFDGPPHPLKRATLDERRDRRAKAEVEWKAALAEGDLERARTKAQQTARLTPPMVEQLKLLLRHLGVPSVDAPGDGEAQASLMARSGAAHAAASQDFDSLLYGAEVLVRNLTLAGRRKLPRKNLYVDVVPEEIRLSPTLEGLHLTREQLVDLALLVGTDFNSGIRGVGPKKALKYLTQYGRLERVLAEKKWEIPEMEEIRHLFLEPPAAVAGTLEWRPANRDGVQQILCSEFEFSLERVQSTLARLPASIDPTRQENLDRFF